MTNTKQKNVFSVPNARKSGKVGAFVIRNCIVRGPWRAESESFAIGQSRWVHDPRCVLIDCAQVDLVIYREAATGMGILNAGREQ